MNSTPPSGDRPARLTARDIRWGPLPLGDESFGELPDPPPDASTRLGLATLLVTALQRIRRLQQHLHGALDGLNTAIAMLVDLDRQLDSARRVIAHQREQIRALMDSTRHEARQAEEQHVDREGDE